MEKTYKCAHCGSISKDIAGTCCGEERKEVSANVCVACETGVGEHTHEVSAVDEEHKCEHC